MDYSIGNAEFVLLLLIAESPGINGYTIRAKVNERGFDAWAGVASSSIYNGLKRIEARQLSVGGEDLNKDGRGPRGQAYHITKKGSTALRRAITSGLSTTREHDPRFNLALSGIGFISAKRASTCLADRDSFLDHEVRRLEAVASAAGGGQDLPLGATLLFDRIIAGIQAERVWLANAAKLLDEQVRS